MHRLNGMKQSRESVFFPLFTRNPPPVVLTPACPTFLISESTMKSASLVIWTSMVSGWFMPRYSVDAATSVLTLVHAKVFLLLIYAFFMCGALFIRRTHRNLWSNLAGDQPTTAVSHHSSDPPQRGQLCLPQGLGKRQLWQGTCLRCQQIKHKP